eukprot:1159899-Pelagomonas_calceolata.AAC.1
MSEQRRCTCSPASKTNHGSATFCSPVSLSLCVAFNNGSKKERKKEHAVQSGRMHKGKVTCLERQGLATQTKRKSKHRGLFQKESLLQKVSY